MLRMTQLVNDEQDLKPGGRNSGPDSLTLKLDSKSLLGTFHGTLGSPLPCTCHTFFYLFSFSAKFRVLEFYLFIRSNNK